MSINRNKDTGNGTQPYKVKQNGIYTRGLVTFWGNSISKIKHWVSMLPSGDIQDNIMNELNKGKIRPYKNIHLLDGDKVVSLLDEIHGLLLRCSIPEQISNYIKDLFREIKETIRKAR